MKQKTTEITLKKGQSTTITITGDVNSIQDALLMETVTLNLNLDEEKKDIIEEMLFNSELYKYFKNFIQIAKKIEKGEIK